MPTSDHRQINILVVDDGASQREILQEVLTQMGYQVAVRSSAQESLKLLEEETINLVLTDLNMPGMNGIEFLNHIKQINPDIGVIVVTGHGTVETAVEAMKKGADDFMEKPVEFDVLELTVKRVLEKKFLLYENKKLSLENQNLKRELGLKYHSSSTIGLSAASKKLNTQIQIYAKSNDPVLILGESGSQEDDFSRTIHYNSAYASNPILFFDCKSIPEEFQDIHLFGKFSPEKELNRPGLVEKADHGTLVIENVTLLNRKSQEKLIATLKNKKSQRIGSENFYATKIRLIATSLQSEFESWVNARTDLYDLLKQDIIFIPSLRDRVEDIPILAFALMKRFASIYNRNIESIDKSLLDLLATYRFPGNYKEFESLIETAVIRCYESVLKTEHLSSPLR